MQTTVSIQLMGCLPVLIQMPILIGFYHAISRMNATPEINLGTFLDLPTWRNQVLFLQL